MPELGQPVMIVVLVVMFAQAAPPAKAADVRFKANRWMEKGAEANMERDCSPRGLGRGLQIGDHKRRDTVLTLNPKFVGLPLRPLGARALLRLRISSVSSRALPLRLAP